MVRVFSLNSIFLMQTKQEDKIKSEMAVPSEVRDVYFGILKISGGGNLLKKPSTNNVI